MPSRRYASLGGFLQGALALALVLMLLGEAVIAVVLARRPPRTNHRERLFQGVIYARQVRSMPRPLMIHIIEIELSVQNIGFLVTPGDKASSMDLFAASTSEFLSKFDLQVAINGSFFKPFHSRDFTIGDYYPHSGDPVDVRGLAISNGEVYSADEGSYPKVCISGRDVRISEGYCPVSTAQALAGSELIIASGEVVTADGDLPGKPEPRTAIGLDEEMEVLWLVVVDGRQPGYSEGVTLGELAGIMLEVGASTALNLDGGGSSTMVVAGQSGPRILNAPIHTRVPMRERPVANHLGVYTTPLQGTKE